MKMFYSVSVFVVSFLCFLKLSTAKTIGLYSTDDDIVILSSKNFYDTVLGTDNAWMVEFYNAWCGHCIHFAPTWKKLGKDLKGWQKVISLAAIDCSASENLKICRSYNINGYPNFKILPPYSDKNTTGELFEEQNEKAIMKKLIEFVSDDAVILDLCNYKQLSSRLYVQDLESALSYSFRQEIAIKKTITGDTLQALKQFIAVLAKYFPGKTEIKTYLWRLSTWLEHLTDDITGREWAEKLDSLQISSVEVLSSINGYMQNFFGCKECSKNFNKMASSLGDEVTNHRDAVLWLWRAHNKANKRLHGDKSEDPKHPKIQFPPKSMCPSCYFSDDDPSDIKWNAKQFYRKSGILDLPDKKDISAENNSNSNELDWWELKQRKTDLEKIRDILEWKKQRSLTKKTKYHHSRFTDGISKDVKEETFYFKRTVSGWGFSNVDFGMCVMFYFLCTVLIVILYYHFIVRRRYKPP
ncbi:hypothetical protein KUTeg_022073, partial [Tegillarca granosa]